MNICTGLIDYYDQILTGFLFKRAVCHLSGDGRGERWVPHSFFVWLYLIRTSKETHLNQDELKVRKIIMQIFPSSICALYNVFYPLYLLYCTQICRICQQYPKEIVHCLFVYSLLTPGLFSSWNDENKLC